jgi:hypothetical protein
MTGSRITAPAVKGRWLVFAMAGLGVAVVLFARTEAATFVTSPAALAAAVAIAAGLVAQRSMALTPWVLVAVGLALYAVQGSLPSPRAVVGILEVLCFSVALVVGIYQMKITLVGGDEESRPSRARWGSVLVAGATCLSLLVLSRPDVVILRWARNDVVLAADSQITRSSFGTPERVGRIQDSAIAESSGLVARVGSKQLWTINDSGNLPRIYCLSLIGASCGTWDVTGTTNDDWEAIAAGPGPDPDLRYLYLGDIGNNALNPKNPVVYRVQEPDPALRVAPVASSSPAEVLSFVYPDGPHDAEALLVHPQTGDVYIIAKEANAGVYKASAPFDSAAPIPLERVARLSIFGSFSDITGADISPDGRHLAVSTYGGWYELILPPPMTIDGTEDSFDLIWKATPESIGSLVGRQWEAIAYRAGGRSLFMTSEGVHSAIYRARLGDG